jgi:hypothetical protein
MTVVLTLPAKFRTGLGDVRRNSQRVEMVWEPIASWWLNYSLAVRILILIRKRREAAMDLFEKKRLFTH